VVQELLHIQTPHHQTPTTWGVLFYYSIVLNKSWIQTICISKRSPMCQALQSAGHAKI